MASGSGGFDDKRECAPSKPVMTIFIERQHLDWNVPRGRVLLEMVQYCPTKHVRKKYVQRDSGRMEFASESQGFRLPFSATRTLKSQSRVRGRRARERSEGRLRRSAESSRLIAGCGDHPRCVQPPTHPIDTAIAGTGGIDMLTRLHVHDVPSLSRQHRSAEGRE